jgi:hypothetical protein
MSTVPPSPWTDLPIPVTSHCYSEPFFNQFYPRSFRNSFLQYRIVFLSRIDRRRNRRASPIPRPNSIGKQPRRLRSTSLGDTWFANDRSKSSLDICSAEKGLQTMILTTWGSLLTFVRFRYPCYPQINRYISKDIRRRRFWPLNQVGMGVRYTVYTRDDTEQACACFHDIAVACTNCGKIICQRVSTCV